MSFNTWWYRDKRRKKDECSITRNRNDKYEPSCGLVCVERFIVRAQDLFGIVAEELKQPLVLPVIALNLLLSGRFIGVPRPLGLVFRRRVGNLASLEVDCWADKVDAYDTREGRKTGAIKRDRAGRSVVVELAFSSFAVTAYQEVLVARGRCGVRPCRLGAWAVRRIRSRLSLRTDDDGFICCISTTSPTRYVPSSSSSSSVSRISMTPSSSSSSSSLSDSSGSA